MTDPGERRAIPRASDGDDPQIIGIGGGTNDADLQQSEQKKLLHRASLRAMQLARWESERATEAVSNIGCIRCQRNSPSCPLSRNDAPLHIAIEASLG